MFYKFITENQHVFRVHLLDIEELNEGLLGGRFDVSKCSVAVYPLIAQEYALLPVGMAMGYGTGPLLVGRDPRILISENTRVGIPGKYTTAFALLRRYFPQVKETKELLFSSIPDEISQGKIDVGVIIHETRFTYQQKGLSLVADLGKMWEDETKLPLPLGAIAIRRELVSSYAKQWAAQLKSSILYAWTHRQEVLLFCRQYATEMDEEVMLNHIKLYVNAYSLDAGVEGRKATELLISSVQKDHVNLSQIWAI